MWGVGCGRVVKGGWVGRRRGGGVVGCLRVVRCGWVGRQKEGGG